MKSDGALRVPVKFERGSMRGEEAIASAIWLIEHMCEHLGLEDHANAEVLDFGCGVKFTQALINHSLPIKKYVGVDVYREMIDFLRENVHDPRFEYFHIDAHNELYNPDGETLSEDATLPIEGRAFDVICLFSVFTHLAPHDYRTMLKLLRRHVKPDGRLFFTLYIDELTAGGHGLMDGWTKALSQMPSEELAKHMKKKPEAVAQRRIETFKDLDPKKPLKWAVYSERYARELMEDTGWEAVSLSPPDAHIQHHFVCAPR
jgi:SAM-dependent methyltransferase